jgi:hypothetical protein
MEQVLGWMQLMLWIVRYYVDDNNTLLCIYALRTPHHLIFSDMEKMMTHWHRLLQITGGDLCLEKCKVSVLTWHYNNRWAYLQLAQSRNVKAILLWYPHWTRSKNTRN